MVEKKVREDNKKTEFYFFMNYLLTENELKRFHLFVETKVDEKKKKKSTKIKWKIKKGKSHIRISNNRKEGRIIGEIQSA